MTNSYDLLVVGAGPAGSTAAKLAADAGYRVLLVDKALFPRHKTCASWINRLAFEQFPYLEAHKDKLVDSAFHGVTFFNHDLRRRATWSEPRPSGYLSLRSRFDTGLKDIAVAAGVDFREGSGLAALAQSDDGVTLRLESGEEFSGRALIGADGAHSRVAALTGLRQGWSENEAVLCANEDLPCAAEEIAGFYPPPRPLLVALEFDALTGYGWIFPKREHICVGIGGRLRAGERIQDLYQKFFRAAQEHGLLPAALQPIHPYYALDPAGGVNKGKPLVQGRVVLVGDAAGFVSGTTGEGIYPAMVSAQVAVEVIGRGFRTSRLAAELPRFQTLWRERLGGYLRALPGGERRRQTVDRIGLIFRSRLVCGLAARTFLYGEPLSLRTLARSLWP